MVISSHKFNIRKDLRRSQVFLSNLFKFSHRLLNWFPDRLESNLREMEAGAWIWEHFNKNTSEKRIVAMITVEGPFNYFMLVHPNYYFIEPEILETIENEARKKKKEQKKKITKIKICIPEGLKNRENLLENSGYINEGHFSNIRFRRAESPLQEIQLKEGFQIRGVDNASDLNEIARLIELSFGSDKLLTVDRLKELIKKSFYKRDLDLVVVTADNAIVSYCSFKMDPISKITRLENLCTHFNYRGAGLAKALIEEGARRATIYGVTLFYMAEVETTFEANNFYESTGFTTIVKEYIWSKEV